MHRPTKAVVTLAALAVFAPLAAESTASTIAQGPPQAYTLVRYDEDYSYLKDPALRSDLFDPIKYIPLNQAGDWYLSFGGQARERYEFFNHNTFGAGTQDKDGYVLTRLTYNMDAHLGPFIRGFVQGVTALENGREGGPRPVDVNTIDLFQGFLDVRLPLGHESAFTFRTGREALSFGRERLIGVADWPNNRRSFDGFRCILNTPNNELDLFWVRPVVVDKYEFDNDEGHTNFSGIYDTLSLPELLPKAKSKLEMYGLALNQNTIARWPSLPGPGSENRYTLGSHFSTNPKPFDFDVEADYQFGDFKDHAIHAYSVAMEGGYTADCLRPTPRFFLGFDIASGDHHPGRDGLGTFNQLFPSGHPYFGYIDAIGRQNIIDLHPGADVLLLEHKRLAERLNVRAEYHQFWRQSTSDAVYNALGAVIRTSGASHASSIGSEIDLLLNWQIDRHLGAYAGYSHFFAGDFIHQTGAHMGIDFFYLAGTYTF